MKTILIILLMAGCQSVISQKNDTLRKYLSADFSFTSKNKMFYPALAFPSNNHWVLYATYPDNSPLLTAFFRDKNLTILDGPYRLYFSNRKLARSGHYRNGNRDGVWRYWYINGHLKDSGIIVNNQLVGRWYTWHNNGNLAMVIDYSFPNSNFNSEKKSKNSFPRKKLVPEDDELIGSKEGSFIRYNPDGKMSDSGQYRGNRKTGLWKTWFLDGQLEASGQFENDSLHGEWTWYRENGTIATQENYRNNKLVSLKCFDESGRFTGEYCSILKPPVPLGNFTDFDNYLLDNIMMPKELHNKKIEATITIHCAITKDGKLTEVKINGCPYKSLENEIEKFFLGIKEWSPAILHNRPVDLLFEYILPLSIPG